MSNTAEDGIIKYKLSLKMTPPLKPEDYIDLEKWRVILYRMGAVGEYRDSNIGYGNLSKRIPGTIDQFIITGSQTGRYPNLNGRQYTKVLKCSIDKASIEAMGPIAPSSEALTHFGIYQLCNDVNFVFHIHHLELWSSMCKQQGMFTPKDISYGTKEMAEAVKKLISSKPTGVIAMGGHSEGIISWGETAEQAGKLLLDAIKKLG